MKIDINKKYRTRNGREVTHLHRAPEGFPGAYPWRGMIEGVEQTWMDDGSAYKYQEVDDDDLIEVREPREWWANVYPDGQMAIHNSEEDARTACAVGGETIRVREIID